MKVLITGFKPFNNEKINHSEEIVNLINNYEHTILDVVYDECYHTLTNKFDLNDFDLIISIGEARSRTETMIESSAKNISSCSLKDNKGNLFIDKKIDDNSNDILYTKVNINKCTSIFKISNDAGKFVCNNLYFHLLKDYPDKSIFIHVHNCNKDEYLTIIDKINQIIRILEKN